MKTFQEAMLGSLSPVSTVMNAVLSKLRLPCFPAHGLEVNHPSALLPARWHQAQNPWLLVSPEKAHLGP